MIPSDLVGQPWTRALAAARLTPRCLVSTQRWSPCFVHASSGSAPTQLLPGPISIGFFSTSWSKLLGIEWFSFHRRLLTSALSRLGCILSRTWTNCSVNPWVTIALSRCLSLKGSWCLWTSQHHGILPTLGCPKWALFQMPSPSQAVCNNHQAMFRCFFLPGRMPWVAFHA